MDISKLTVQGFKSFYEKSVFTFGQNVTAIVGPNGSGKSNITESIRFVLGEQSTKSMRGKDITDLLFRGNSARSSKATVQIDFVKNQKTSNFLKGDISNVFIKNALEKDTVSISRTIYQDGKSEYMMNGVEVRVKDIHEFLLYIHLGNKSSWHISQGEADRVLIANATERKQIIEDALGLKVYHARINESQKKLEKGRENIREATIKRREITPELNMLGKQVEKIRRSAEFRADLENKASVYLNYKNQGLQKLKDQKVGSESVQDLEKRLEDLTAGIAEKQKGLYRDGGHDQSFLETELEREQKVLDFVKTELSKAEAESRNYQNNLSYSKLEQEKTLSELKKVEDELNNVYTEGNDIIFPEHSINSTRDKISAAVGNISATQNLSEAKNLAEGIDFEYKKLISEGTTVNKDNVKQISYLQSIVRRLQEKLQDLSRDIEMYEEKVQYNSPKLESLNLKVRLSSERVEEINKQILEFKYKKVEVEKDLQNLIFERSAIQHKITESQEFESRVNAYTRELEQDVFEFKTILGQSFKVLEIDTKIETEEEFTNLKRNIERLKIRLEESNVSNSEEVEQNFKDLTERDNFLVREISDLETSMANLENLIADLKENLKKEFEIGLKHIDKVFDSYVKKLFGGGGAKVYLSEIETKKKSVEGDEDEGEVGEVKTGVEVEVEIPKKKIKGLQSLSGGERALVSIALNFSIIHQNPAPFMILDETDATLDEANAKRYGEILEMLKEQTKLIVVTHNRETMHFADQVYGVTLSKEGHSKVLSVSFEDAIEYAK